MPIRAGCRSRGSKSRGAFHGASGRVERIEERRSFETRRGTRQPSSSVWYKITNTGIDLIEGGSSAFRRADPFAGINVTAVGSTVQVGNDNYASTELAELPSELDTLVDSAQLDERTKLEAVADIESLKMQIVKPEPNRTIIGAAWAGIEKVMAAAGLVERFSRTSERIGELL